MSSDEELAAFVTARLDEVEAAAKEAASGDPRARSWAEGESDYPLVKDGWHVVVVPPGPTWGQVRHIARHDPARVLREIEDGRALIAEYRRALEKAPGNRPLLNTLIRLIRSRAAVWSDHPAYRQEWAPATG